MKTLLRTPMVAVILLLTATLFSGCITYTETTSRPTYYDDYRYSNPTWAPTYYAGARYYYFPDIECYYDLATRDFIMLNRGHWLFVPSIIPYYSTFDLYSSYIVIINNNVFQPWMHHQYYNSHYPRYYYIDYYDYSNIPYVRGFNENSKGAIFWSESERGRARQWDDRNLRNNRRFTYSSADKRVQQETTQRVNRERAAASVNNRDRNTTPSRGTGSTSVDRQNPRTSASSDSRREATTRAATDANQRSQREASSTSRTQTSTRSSETNYYGSPIGTPVRVEPQMRRTETSNSSRTTNETNTRRESSGSSNSRSSSTSSSRK